MNSRGSGHCLYGWNGQSKLVVLQSQTKGPDSIAIGGGADTHRFHCPWQAIDKASLYELKRFRLLSDSDAR